jgi:hypothetical protein
MSSPGAAPTTRVLALTERATDLPKLLSAASQTIAGSYNFQLLGRGGGLGLKVKCKYQKMKALDVDCHQKNTVNMKPVDVSLTVFISGVVVLEMLGELVVGNLVSLWENLLACYWVSSS